MSQFIRNLIAKKVQYYRTRLKLSREELSLQLDLDNSYISKLERGKINLTIDKLAKIIEYFNVTIEEFFSEQ